MIGQGGGSGSIAGISANGQGAPVSFKFISTSVREIMIHCIYHRRHIIALRELYSYTLKGAE